MKQESILPTFLVLVVGLPNPPDADPLVGRPPWMQTPLDADPL